jgi:hypothetical protein
MPKKLKLKTAQSILNLFPIGLLSVTQVAGIAEIGRSQQEDAPELTQAEILDLVTTIMVCRFKSFREEIQTI